MAHLRVVARLISKPDKTAETQELLASLVGPTRAEEGCIQYELLQNESDPTDFTFVEQWTSGAALDAHLASSHIKAALSRFPELLAADPDIRRYSLVS